MASGNGKNATLKSPLLMNTVREPGVWLEHKERGNKQPKEK